MRTKGALNKPKFAFVQWSELQRYINPNACVPVKISFLQELGYTPSNLNGAAPVAPIEAQSPPQEKTLQFTISD